MSLFFPLNVTLTQEQQAILDDSPNIIVSGPAGTGKTLLVILLAQKLAKSNLFPSIAVLVLTKSLKRFIMEAFAERNLHEIEVYYLAEWNFEKYDYILIDEAQDFSSQKIKAVVGAARVGVYIFGDSRQRILEETDGNKTLTIEEIASLFSFPLRLLSENIRFTSRIKDFLCEAYDETRFGENKSEDGDLPEVYQCSSEKDELKKLLQLLQGNNFKGTIGILVMANYQVTCILQFLQSNGITEIGAKVRGDESLIFADGIANVMTVHSSKGMEFDNVILPFLTKPSRIQYLYYVAISRARKRLILTYSSAFPLVIKVHSKRLYKGFISRYWLIDTTGNSIYKYHERLEKAKKENNSDEITKLSIEREQLILKVNDCKIYSGVEKDELDKFIKYATNVLMLD